MTTNTTPNPGAAIDIRLSDTALAHHNQEEELGSIFNFLLEKQKVFLNPDGVTGTLATGGAMSVTLPEGQVIRFNGTREQSSLTPSDGSKPLSLLTVSVSTSDPDAYSTVTRGSMIFSATVNGKEVTVKSTGAKINSYQLDRLDPYESPGLGRISVSYTGLMDTLAPEVLDLQDLSTFIAGNVTSLNFSAAKLLRSASFKGDLKLVASDQISLPSEPLTTESPPVYVVKTAVSGTINSYNASYYDGSYVKLSSIKGITANAQTSASGLMDDAALWSGDDDLRVELPAQMQKTWNIHTGAGNDKVSAKGGGGELMIDTGTGDDQITLLDDSPIVRGGDGIDTIYSRLMHVDLWRYTDVENFVFTGRTAAEVSGNALDNTLTGGNLGDTLHGDFGNDTLIGLNGNDQLDGGTGNDQLWGGGGNDTYFVDSADDVVNEARSASHAADSGGRDTVVSGVSFTLGSYMENLQLTGDYSLSGMGNALSNTLTGNDADNDLSGEGGHDTLLGNGGNDTLKGGIGNDSLDGDTGNDLLDGGSGADVMRGGAGDDRYVVDSAADRLYETVSATDKADAGGMDTVFASLSFTLADTIEHLTLTGSGNINGTGNAASNAITGNAADNLINGKGGIDKLDGGDGSDIYLISAAGEHTDAEIADTGRATDIDEVRFAPAAPAAGADAPVLTLFAADTGLERAVIGTGTGKIANTSGKMSAHIDASAVQNSLTLVGNAGTNHLTGTAFDDVLIGNGGKDVLTGGLGADKFIFNVPPNARTEVDTLIDFTSGTDQLVFVRSKFAGLGTGDTLQASAFHSGDGANKALDADDRFIYDSASGQLYFDKDGTGASAMVLIGVLDAHPALSAGDFRFVDAF